MDDIGTDIKSSWDFNEKGDLILVSDEANIVQAVKNRLGCQRNSLDLYYMDYGSVLTQFLGWPRTDETLEFIKLEIENTLQQDPRLPSYTLEVSYDDDSSGVVIKLDFDLVGEDLSMSLIIDEYGSVDVVESNVMEDETEGE